MIDWFIYGFSAGVLVGSFGMFAFTVRTLHRIGKAQQFDGDGRVDST